GVEEGDACHAAVAVPRVEIGAEHRILFGGRHRGAHFADDIAVAIEDTPHTSRRLKILGYHPDRDARAAVFAGGPIGDGLAASKTAVRQQIVWLSGPLADEMRQHLPLPPPPHSPTQPPTTS